MIQRIMKLLKAISLLENIEISLKKSIIIISFMKIVKNKVRPLSELEGTLFSLNFSVFRTMKV
jgi:hypothetical protein